MELARKIPGFYVPEKSVGIFFMGQAGFILKSASGCTLAVDLYLSNCCERYFGFKRLTPELLLPGEIELDYILTSHAHYDHFDVDSIPILLSNGRTRLYTAVDGVAECKRLGIPPERYSVLQKGKDTEAGDFTILPTDCDHGELAPDALGLYISCGEKHLYFAGDTCFREDIAEDMAKRKIDFAAAPINGAFGNMNSEEAVRFFSIIEPALCVPCHYWNFVQHKGDPNAFVDYMERGETHLSYMLMRPGEGMCI